MLTYVLCRIFLVVAFVLVLVNLRVIFGVLDDQSALPFRVVAGFDSGYEVRHYASSVAAWAPTETPDATDPAPHRYSAVGPAVSALWQYVGLLSPTPANSRREKIQLVWPMAQNATAVWLFMPAQFARLAALPTPSDRAVRLAEWGDRYEAVLEFTGTVSEEMVDERLTRLKGFLESDGIEADERAGSSVGFVATYNTWLTLPSFRTNEVHVPVAWEEGEAWDATREIIQ
eukprot:Selendium_serpulae@DN3502_c0_g1_i1.p2